MKPYDPRLRDLYNGDPDIFQEYHQDYREGIYNPFGQGATPYLLILCLLPVIYHILFILDYNLLPLPELIWNILVYLTPLQLIDAVESFQNPLRITNPALKGIPRTHAAKSEALRRVLGLDKPGGIIGSVAQAGRRRLSTLPGINMHNQGADGRPAGLGNWDNSCYQNSVLQGLASLDTLSVYLTHPKVADEKDDEMKDTEMKMADALRQLIATLNDPSNNGRRVWTPATLKNMSSWQQQDAQEYFSKVLDEIDKEIGRVAMARNLTQGLEAGGSSTKRLTSEVLPISTFRNPLEGLIAQRVGCTTCGYSEGLSMIPFNCLTVPLGRAWEYDVAECLDEYTKLERIDGVECGKCTLLKNQRLLSTIVQRTAQVVPETTIHKESKERLAAVNMALEEDDYEEKTLLNKCKIMSRNRVTVTKSRQAVIARPPKSLAVHVNRSLFDENSGELRKNYSEVRFPTSLDLGPWCLGSAKGSEDAETEEWLLNPDKPMIASSTRTSRVYGPIYELRAVLTHYGRHENGHYICYKKHPLPLGSEAKEKKDQWWRLSDDDVIRVSEENVLGQGGVFMLFYDCVEPSIPASSSIEVPEPIFEDASSSIDINTDEVALKQQLSSTDILAIATSTPLPDVDDDVELLEFKSTQSIIEMTEDSIAASVSEFDEEESIQTDEQDYQPTKAIVVPPYLGKAGAHIEGEGAGQDLLSPGSLLMV